MNDTNVQVADVLFEALLAGDGGKLEELFDPAAVLWHNFTGHEDGRAAFVPGFVRFAGMVQGLKFEDVRRVGTPTGFVEQHTLTGRTADGTPVAIRECLIGTVKDGRITRLNEYLDSAQLAPLAPGRSA
jgi:uncharacterized protein